MTRKGKYLVLDELSQDVARRCLVVGGQFSAFFEMAIACDAGGNIMGAPFERTLDRS